MRTCSTCKTSYAPKRQSQRHCSTACRDRQLGRKPRVRDASRGTTAERGYGYSHKQERERWRPIVEAGQVVCARCGHHIHPGAAWQLDHRDDDRTQYLGPSHKACNLRAGAVKGNRERGRPAVRRWAPRIAR